MSEEKSLEAVWKHIDKHRDELSGIKENIHGISERMGVLEVRFEASNKAQTEGHARIETKLDTVLQSVATLNQEKTKEEGRKEAQNEQRKFIKWIIGGVLALIGSGALSIQFISDRANSQPFQPPQQFQGSSESR